MCYQLSVHNHANAGDTYIHIQIQVVEYQLVLSAPIDTVLSVMTAIAIDARLTTFMLLRLIIIIMKPFGQNFVVVLYLRRNYYFNPLFKKKCRLIQY